MNLEPYSFQLPDDRIAAYPAEPADASRLMMLSATGGVSHHIFRELPGLLREGDVLVLNRTRVSNRRLRLRRKNDAVFEALFLESREAPHLWRCMVRKSGRLKTGEILRRGDVGFRFRERDGALCLLEALTESGAPAWAGPNEAEAFFETYGEPPIPPYLGRSADETDRKRYQTVFARIPGSVAAPTAGLHFTPGLLDALSRNHEVAWVELTIGYGTFAPLTEKNFEEKRLHTEAFVIPEETASLLRNAREQKRRIIAVGTTTLRALESVRRQRGDFQGGQFQTDLFLFPPDRPEGCDGLLTNFHLPASSLFLLVCAFAGTEQMRNAYRIAIQEGYRFYSYGDAMFIERPESD